MNTIAYLLYLLLTYLITVHVGLIFYRNGRVYILRLFQGDEAFTDFVNRILLTGYYLLNLGYAALMLQTWKTITTIPDMLGSISTMTGRILLTLAVIHYINMAVIVFLSKRKQSFLHHKH